MTNSQPNDQQAQCRLLVIDDNEAIHNDFSKVLCQAPTDNGLAELDNELLANNLIPI